MTFHVLHFFLHNYASGLLVAYGYKLSSRFSRVRNDRRMPPMLRAAPKPHNCVRKNEGQSYNLINFSNSKICIDIDNFLHFYRVISLKLRI